MPASKEAKTKQGSARKPANARKQAERKATKQKGNFNKLCKYGNKNAY